MAAGKFVLRAVLFLGASMAGFSSMAQKFPGTEFDYSSPYVTSIKGIKNKPYLELQKDADKNGIYDLIDSYFMTLKVPAQYASLTPQIKRIYQLSAKTYFQSNSNSCQASKKEFSQESRKFITSLGESVKTKELSGFLRALKDPRQIMFSDIKMYERSPYASC